MSWSWGAELDGSDSLYACPRCAAAVKATRRQQHHDWHVETGTA